MTDIDAARQRAEAALDAGRKLATTIKHEHEHEPDRGTKRKALP